MIKHTTLLTILVGLLSVNCGGNPNSILGTWLMTTTAAGNYRFTFMGSETGGTNTLEVTTQNSPGQGCQGLANVTGTWSNTNNMFVVTPQSGTVVTSNCMDTSQNAASRPLTASELSLITIPPTGQTASVSVNGNTMTITTSTGGGSQSNTLTRQ